MHGLDHQRLDVPHGTAARRRCCVVTFYGVHHLTRLVASVVGAVLRLAADKAVVGPHGRRQPRSCSGENAAVRMLHVGKLIGIRPSAPRHAEDCCQQVVGGDVAGGRRTGTRASIMTITVGLDIPGHQNRHQCHPSTNGKHALQGFHEAQRHHGEKDCRQHDGAQPPHKTFLHRLPPELYSNLLGELLSVDRVFAFVCHLCCFLEATQEKQENAHGTCSSILASREEKEQLRGCIDSM